MKFRRAETADMDQVVHLLAAMLEEMASFGGDAPGEKDEVTRHLRTRFLDCLSDEDHLYLVGEADETSPTPAAVIEARVIHAEKVFKPARRLHIHAVYVLPAFREKGAGERLLEKAMRWGRSKGCSEADLNVLVNNPAIRLYQKMGYQPFELNMRQRI